MATTSTVPTFLSELQVMLAASPVLADVQVTLGIPGDTIERKCLWIGGTDGQFSIPTMKAGRKYRDEEYEVKVYIDVILPGGTQTEAVTTAYSYLAVIENILADNPATPSHVNAAVAGRFTTSMGLESSAAWARLEIGINVFTRLL